MRKRFIVVIVFILMTLPVYAHVYDANGFEDLDLGAIVEQEPSLGGSIMWWGLPWSDIEDRHPYIDAVVEKDPALDDPNGNKVLNMCGSPGLNGASINDDWCWIDGIIHEPNEGTWILAEFDFYVNTLSRNLSLYFYDNDSSDPAVVAFGKEGAGIISYKTGGVYHAFHTYEIETWMRIRIVLDQNSDTMDFYLDGELLLEGVGIANDAISCERLCFATRDNNDKVLIDNLITEWSHEDYPPPPYCGDENTVWLAGDISGPGGEPDCYVDNYDLDAFIQNWLECSDPAEPLCN